MPNLQLTDSCLFVSLMCFAPVRTLANARDKKKWAAVQVSSALLLFPLFSFLLLPLKERMGYVSIPRFVPRVPTQHCRGRLLVQSGGNRNFGTTGSSFATPPISLLGPGPRFSIHSSLFSFLFSAAWQAKRLHWGTKGEANTYVKGVFGDNYPWRKEKGWESWYLDECGERRECQLMGYRREAFTELCHSSPASLLPLLELSHSFSFVKSTLDTTLPSPPKYFVI